MLNALIGQKIDQTQTFLENGQRIPVTEVTVTDNIVVQVKTVEKDKYNAIQVGVGTKKKPTKALIGHSKKASIETVPTLVREVAWEGNDEMPKTGDVIAVEAVFKPGDIVKVTGTSKGKGFAGGVKRHHFKGGPKTHGQSDRHRGPGSIGQGTTPGRVYKGKRMAGHMGVETVTVTNLTIVDVDPENNKLFVLGLVPGNKKGMIIVTKTGEKKKFVKLLSVKLKEDQEAKIEADKVAKEQAETAQKEEIAPVEPAANDAKSEEAPVTTTQDTTEKVVETDAPVTETQTTSESEITEEVVQEVKEAAEETKETATQENTKDEASVKEKEEEK